MERKEVISFTIIMHFLPLNGLTTRTNYLKHHNNNIIIIYLFKQCSK